MSRGASETRARLVGALAATGANAGDLSVLAGRERNYLSDFLRGRFDALDPGVATFLAAVLGLDDGIAKVRELRPR